MVHQLERNYAVFNNLINLTLRTVEGDCISRNFNALFRSEENWNDMITARCFVRAH